MNFRKQRCSEYGYKKLKWKLLEGFDIYSPIFFLKNSILAVQSKTLLNQHKNLANYILD